MFTSRPKLELEDTTETAWIGYDEKRSKIHFWAKILNRGSQPATGCRAAFVVLDGRYRYVETSESVSMGSAEEVEGRPSKCKLKHIDVPANGRAYCRVEIDLKDQPAVDEPSIPLEDRGFFPFAKKPGRYFVVTVVEYGAGDRAFCFNEFYVNKRVLPSKNWKPSRDMLDELWGGPHHGWAMRAVDKAMIGRRIRSMRTSEFGWIIS